MAGAQHWNWHLPVLPARLRFPLASCSTPGWSVLALLCIIEAASAACQAFAAAAWAHTWVSQEFAQGLCLCTCLRLHAHELWADPGVHVSPDFMLCAKVGLAS